jgi:hypothetical protein
MIIARSSDRLGYEPKMAAEAVSFSDVAIYKLRMPGWIYDKELRDAGYWLHCKEIIDS